MSITIASNIAALRAQRNLSKTSEELSSVFERLSSGMRINRAKDDAAGLALSQSLQSDARVYRQGVRNLNDGISLLNIADAALQNLVDIVTRIEELAQQAANGVLSDSQRQALDLEAGALSDEFLRIAKTTSYNSLNLLNGDVQGINLQAGYGSNAVLPADLGGALGTGTFQSPSTFAALNLPDFLGVVPGSPVTSGDFNGDGHLDYVTTNFSANVVAIYLGTGSGSFSSAQTVSIAAGSAYGVTSGDYDNDGDLDLVAKSLGGVSSVLSNNGTGSFSLVSTFLAGGAGGSIVSGDFNGDGRTDIASVTGGAIAVNLNLGGGTFGAHTLYGAGGTGGTLVTGDFNGDSILDLVDVAYGVGGGARILFGTGSGTFGAATAISIGAGSLAAGVAAGDFNGDGFLDLAETEMGGTGVVNVVLNNGNGTFGAVVSYNVGNTPTDVIAADFNGDGILDLAATGYSNRISILIGSGNGTFTPTISYAVTVTTMKLISGDFNGDGVVDIVGAKYAPSANIYLGQTEDGVAALLPFSLDTIVGARQALPILQRKREQLSLQRATIGASQSRIEVAMNTLQAASDNFLTAAGRIIDADIAEETAKLVRLKILQQAGAAVLAQANQQPALVLKLLAV